MRCIGSNTANSELTGDESPSRMRTRNKPAKESNNKRPKRGGDTPDAGAANENAKTPNKTDRRKSTKETPTKGKKRSNIDLDIDNDGSDEKEKRKRTDVRVYFIVWIYFFRFEFQFCFLIPQSPTESLNSDSRPGSVLDEQENTSEPPDISMTDAERKENDDKASDPLSTADGSGNSNVKDESSTGAGKTQDTCVSE